MSFSILLIVINNAVQKKKSLLVALLPQGRSKASLLISSKVREQNSKGIRSTRKSLLATLFPPCSKTVRKRVWKESVCKVVLKAVFCFSLADCFLPASFMLPLQLPKWKEKKISSHIHILLTSQVKSNG